MPQKLWAVGEEVLSADFNPYVQNQVVPQFTNAAQRDAQWTTPPKGAMCVTQDTLSLWIFDSATWRRAGAGAAGALLAEHTLLASTATVAAEQVAMTVTTTLTVPRWLRISADTVGTKPGGSTGACRVRIRQTNLAGAELKLGYLPVGVNATFSMHIEQTVQGVIGANTFVTTVQADVDTARLNATSQMTMTDTGPI